jgi:uncharacterized protein with HEPN domain
MNSKKLLKHTQNPKFFLAPIGAHESFVHLIGDLEYKISYQLQNETLKALSFKGEPDLVGLIDSFLAMILGRHITDLKTIKMREFDYFLRDDSSLPLWENYQQIHFEVLGIGEAINIHHKSVKPFYDKKFGKFYELPYSDMLDLVEELVSNYNEINETQIELIDIDYPCIKVNRLNKRLQDYLSFNLQDKRIEIKD